MHLRCSSANSANYSIVGWLLVFIVLFSGVAMAADPLPDGQIPEGILKQLPPGITAEQAEELIRQKLHSADQPPPTSAPNPAPGGNGQIYVGSPSLAVSSISALEILYSKRAGVKLSQFGYDLVGLGGGVSSSQIGTVQDSYVLGPGDSLTVTLRGQENSTYRLFVGRDGTVTLPNIAPLAASGRTFGDFRADLERAISLAFIQTKAYVTVDQVRQLSVHVVGEVTNPGVYQLNGLSTVLDALNLAGGVRKTGSLRNITVVRGSKSFKLDLYALLQLHGATPNMSVAQGDRIVVSPVGPTVAVVGDVRRAAIFELPSGSAGITARGLLALANGYALRGAYRGTLLRILPDGAQEFVSVDPASGAVVRDGEILFVEKAVDESIGRVTLRGAVRLPGTYSLGATKTLQDLLPNAEAFGAEPYLLLAVIQRLDRNSLQRVFIPFSPLHIIQKKENLQLESNDSVTIFKFDQVRELMGYMVAAQTAPTEWLAGTPAGTSVETSAGAAVGGGTPTSSGTSRESGTNSGASRESGTHSGAGRESGTNSPDEVMAGTTHEGPSSPGGVLRFAQIDEFTPSERAYLARVLSQYKVVLQGGVLKPGIFPVMPGTTIADLVRAAGGFNTDTDLSRFEVTSTAIDNLTGVSNTTRAYYDASSEQLASLTVRPFDRILFQHVYSDSEGGSVLLAGEVRFPGNYEIVRGERLSSVIARAGGLTEVAYPIGAVFLRRSVALRQEEAYRAEANDISSAAAAAALAGKSVGSSWSEIAVAPDLNGVVSQSASTLSGADSGTTGSTGATMNFITDLTVRLRKEHALGRLAIVADPAVLATRPDLDFVLEPGDMLVVPRRPASVTIVGEVRNPTGILYDPKLSISDYIERAGGVTRLADEDDTFVVLPDGSTTPLRKSLWSFDNRGIAPGSTIVVPRDVVLPTDWLDVATKVLTIVGQLAVSAASVAVISKY
jgi:protein involved in polysaccharide export with SLBB domain